MKKKDAYTFLFQLNPCNLPPLTEAQKAELDARQAMPDSGIDYSDAPTLTEDFWKTAERGRFYKPIKQQVTARLDADVLAWLKSQGKGYQARMNAILRREMLGCEGAPTRLTCRPQMDAAFTAGSNPARRRRAKPPELRQSCVFRYALSSKIATGEKSDPRNCWNKPRPKGR